MGMQIIFLFLEKVLLHFLQIILFIVYRLSVSVIGMRRYEKYYIGILSVSADMKIGSIGDYRYRQIWKKPYRSYTAENDEHSRLKCNLVRF